MDQGRTTRIVVLAGLGLAAALGVFVAFSLLPSAPTSVGTAPGGIEPAAAPRPAPGRPRDGASPTASVSEPAPMPAIRPAASASTPPILVIPGVTDAAGRPLGTAPSEPEPETPPLDPDVADVLDEVEDSTLVLREAQLGVLAARGVPQDQVQEVRELLDAETETMLTLKQDVMAGGLDEQSATETYKVMRTQADEALAEIIGEELALEIRSIEAQK